MTKHDETLSGLGIPDLKETSASNFYDYENAILDYDTLESLNSVVNQARIGLFKITEKINEYERLEADAKRNYERKLRRSYLASTDKTEVAKKARADLLCEDLENDYIAYQQVKNELVRTSYALRMELQTLQSVGHNLRQQLKVM